jgi:DNA polymerase-1
VSPTGRNPRSPRLQPLPLRTEVGKKIQEAFRDKSPRQLQEVDYSSLELRIIASLFPDGKGPVYGGSSGESEES